MNEVYIARFEILNLLSCHFATLSFPSLLFYRKGEEKE